MIIVERIFYTPWDLVVAVKSPPPHRTARLHVMCTGNTLLEDPYLPETSIKGYQAQLAGSRGNQFTQCRRNAPCLCVSSVYSSIERDPQPEDGESNNTKSVRTQADH